MSPNNKAAHENSKVMSFTVNVPTYKGGLLTRSDGLFTGIVPKEMGGADSTLSAPPSGGHVVEEW